MTISSNILKRSACDKFLDNYVPAFFCRACCRLQLAHVILLTCLLLGAPLAVCCNCPTSYLTSRPVFLQRPVCPARVGRPGPTRSTQPELVMFHPPAPSSPCGLFSSCTALTRPTSCEVGAVTAFSSLPLLPPVFVPFFGALTHLHASSDSSDTVVNFSPRCSIRQMVRRMVLGPSSFSLFPVRSRPAVTGISIPHVSGLPKASS